MDSQQSLTYLHVPVVVVEGPNIDLVVAQQNVSSAQMELDKDLNNATGDRRQSHYYLLSPTINKVGA